MDARRGIDLLRAVTASSVLFIPSSTPYREILMEGVYSLSQLMGLANHSFFNPALRTSRPVLQTLNLITTIISNIEVFAEGVSTMFGSAQQRNLLILIIETTKAMCRLVNILTLQQNTMLLNWGKNESNAATTPDLNDYSSHYRTSFTRILANLHAKSPSLFAPTPICPASFRFGSSISPTVPVAAVSDVGAGIGRLGGLMGHNNKMLQNEGDVKKEEKKEEVAFHGRRSGIRLNTTAFDVISSSMKVPISPIAPRTRTQNNLGALSTAAVTHSDDKKSTCDLTEDEVYAESAHTTPYTIQHNAYHALHSLNTIPSGRSSPEYKDNEPGSIYAPPYNTSPYTSSNIASGYNIGKDMDSLPATPSLGTYEVHHNTPYNHTTSNNDTSTDTTPYNQAASAYNYMHTPSYAHTHNNDTVNTMGTPYRMDRNDSFDSTFSSPPKVVLQFEPENEELVPFNSHDTSFDCEMVFTSIYPSHSFTPTKADADTKMNTLLNATTTTSAKDRFLVENAHYKSNYLEQTSNINVLHSEPIENETSNTAAQPDSDTPDIGGSAEHCAKSINQWTLPQFELCAEDALKLGEMLYILRPLIYAVLVHQIEHYKSKNNTTNGGNDASQSSTDTTPTTGIVTTISSTTTALSLFTQLTCRTSVIVSKVLDTLSVDALLNVLALAVSFVTELLSIKLTEYALRTLRAKARDDTFAVQIKNYLHPNPSANNSSHTERTVSTDLHALNATFHDPLTRGTAVVRKRVYDKYALECKQSAQKHAFDQELNRRRMALFLYLIRSPVFDRATHPLLQTVANSMKNIPLIGSVPEYALGMLTYLNKMHFYNSNS